MTTISSGRHTVTLSPAHPKVAITGTIHATGAAGAYAIAPGAGAIALQAAIFGPDTADFTLKNHGTVISKGTAADDFGIVLGAASTLTNTGLIKAASGAFIAGPASIHNTGTIKGTIGYGIDLLATGTVTNAGTITALATGIAIAGPGAVLDNTGLIAASGTTGPAAELDLGGILSNAGTIRGYRYGLSLGRRPFETGTQSAPNQIINSGLITATDPLYTNPAGTTYLSVALFEHDAGTITNQTSGIIADSFGIALTVAAVDGPPGFSSYTTAAVLNHGTIEGLTALEFLGLGGVTNTGAIIGQRDGIAIVSSLNAVYNSGLVSASDSLFFAYGTAYLAAAITMAGTGAVTNAASGTISATAATGIELHGGSVTNQGAIIAGDRGIDIYGPGYISNAGAITAATDIFISGGLGTVSNTGHIDSSRFYGVQLNAGGLVTNSGTIEGWVKLGAAGTVLNGGHITAATDIVIAGGPGDVDNTGKLVSTSYYSVQLDSGGTVTNRGKISGRVGLTGGGTVDNTGDITGAIVGGALAAVDISNAAGATIGAAGRFSGVDINGGYVYNAGLIAGNGAMLGGFTDPGTVTLTNKGTIWANDFTVSQNFGVYSRGTDTITNAGTIGGLVEGIETLGSVNISNTGTIAALSVGGLGIFAQGGGTVYDAGLIEGLNGASAIGIFAGTGPESLLIIAPTSTIIGAAAVAGELSLATGAGSISFAQFDYFETLSLSAGAAWRASGTTGLQATIDNNGTIILDPGKTLDLAGTLAGTGTIALAAAVTLGGPVAAAQSIDFTNASGYLVLKNPPNFAATIENFALGDTIGLAGIPLSGILATHFVAGVLTLSEALSSLHFTFSNPAAFAGDTFALTTSPAGGTAITLAPAPIITTTPPLTLAPLATFA